MPWFLSFAVFALALVRSGVAQPSFQASQGRVRGLAQFQALASSVDLRVSLVSTGTGRDTGATNDEKDMQSRGARARFLAPMQFPTPAPSAALICLPFEDWPHIDNGVTCGNCTALVETGPNGGRCDRYCESFGQECVAAAEEQSEGCETEYHGQCDVEIVGTSDMLCTCVAAFPADAPTPSPTRPPACEWWCESDVSKNGARHCHDGDMSHFCGSCSYCDAATPFPTEAPTLSPTPPPIQPEACEWWCESDIQTNGPRHCHDGDMSHLCGGCSYCDVAAPSPTEAPTLSPTSPPTMPPIQPEACEWWCESDIQTNGPRHCHDGDMSHLCGGCSYCDAATPVPTQVPPAQSCCSNCGGAYAFCSPVSGSCYHSKGKDYYSTCETTVTTPCAGPACKTVKVMSYNTEYKDYDARMGGYAAKIREVIPDIVGLQECQNRDGLASLSGYTALTDTGNQNYILFDPSKVDLVSGGYMAIPSDEYAPRFITWGLFNIGGVVIWFFNTHLPHNHGEAWSKTTHAAIAGMLLDKREELGAEHAPTIVVGDMNSHASNFNSVSGGGFESNLQANGFVWAYTAQGNPGYGGIDHILYSAAHWTHSGCGDTGTGGSDHTSITCDLTLIA